MASILLGGSGQASGAALAQATVQEPGVTLNSSAAAREADAYERDTDAFFKCVVDHDIVNARIVVLRDLDTKAAKTNTAVKKLSLAASECLGQQQGYRLTTNYILYSGGLARALYLRSNPGRPARNTAAPAAAPAATKLESTTLAGQEIEAMAIFSECVVAKDNLASDAFIRANPGSPAELAALGELKQVMPDCLTTSDKLALSRQSLRAGLSTALYKQYAAAGAAAAGKQ